MHMRDAHAHTDMHMRISAYSRAAVDCLLLDGAMSQLGDHSRRRLLRARRAVADEDEQVGDGARIDDDVLVISGRGQVPDATRGVLLSARR